MKMKLDFLNKYGQWALITGASSGIGKSTARYLASCGVNTIIVSNEIEALEEVSTDIEEKYRTRSIPCFADLSEPDCLDRINESVGGIPVSILVNNAFFVITVAFISNKIAGYHELVNVNIKSYIDLIHIYLPAIIERNRGAVIFLSSINAFSPIAGCAVYRASKSFKLYLGGALWQELKGTAVDVIVITPGPTRANFQKRAGTKVARMAIEPDELAARVIPRIVKRLVFIHRFKNKLITFIGSLLSMEKRIAAASKGYIQLLHKNPGIGIGKLSQEVLIKKKA